MYTYSIYLPSPSNKIKKKKIPIHSPVRVRVWIRNSLCTSSWYTNHNRACVLTAKTDRQKILALALPSFPQTEVPCPSSDSLSTVSCFLARAMHSRGSDAVPVILRSDDFDLVSWADWKDDGGYSRSARAFEISKRLCFGRNVWVFDHLLWWCNCADQQVCHHCFSNFVGL